MTFIKKLFSISVIILLGIILYNGYVTNFWDIQLYLSLNGSGGNDLDKAFAKLKEAPGFSLQGSLTYTYPLGTKDAVKVDRLVDLTVPVTLDAIIPKDTTADIRTTIDLSPFFEIQTGKASVLADILPPNEALSQLASTNFKDISFNLSVDGKKTYVQIPSLTDTWLQLPSSELSNKSEDIQSVSTATGIAPEAALHTVAYAADTTVVVTSTSTTTSVTSQEKTTVTITPTVPDSPAELSPVDVAVDQPLEQSRSLYSSFMWPDFATIVENQEIEQLLDTKTYLVTFPNGVKVHPVVENILPLQNVKKATILLNTKTKEITEIHLSFERNSTIAYEIAMKRFEKLNEQRKGDLRKVQIALEDYFDKEKKYPLADNMYNSLKSTLEPNYISLLPTNPEGENYQYASNGQYFELQTKLSFSQEYPSGSFFRVASQRSPGNTLSLLPATTPLALPLTQNDFAPGTLEVVLKITALPAEQALPTPPRGVISYASLLVKDLPPISTFYELVGELAEQRKILAKDAQRFSALEKTEKALEAYKKAKGTYPVVGTDEVQQSLSEKFVLAQQLVPTYLDTIPVDPTLGRYFGYKSKDGSSYLLTSVLDNKFNPYGEDKKAYTMYRIQPFVPPVHLTETYILQDSITLEEIFTEIPFFNALATLFYKGPDASQTTPTVVAITTPQPTPLSKEQAQKSIESFEEGKPLKDIQFQELVPLDFGYSGYRFTATLTDSANTTDVQYVVHTQSGEIVLRTLSKANDATPIQTPLSQEEAVSIAEDFAKKHFQDFSKQNFDKILATPTTEKPYYTNIWIKKDLKKTVILPVQVEVRVDTTTKQIVYYASMRISSDTNLPSAPLFTKEKVSTLIQDTAKEKSSGTLFTIEEINCYVVADSENPAKQVLAWKGVVASQPAGTTTPTTKQLRYTFVFYDATAKNTLTSLQ